ncbi:MAG: helix-turn-helix domain-containing protein [Thermodesulfobacteriota bacterium]|nr:helix-turn-helix domain-containing protein [Thermodesulfobacteriota bacterium]
MSRPKGSKNKSTQKELSSKQQNFDDDPRLPDKSLFRVDEVAAYFGYKRDAIYRWIQHGILEAEQYPGNYRITREAILECRFKARFDPME